MEINSETLELLENRLSGKVETQVRDRLFKFYRAIWGAVLIALGFFGYNVVSNLNATAKSYAESAVKPSVDNANQAAAAVLAQTNTMSAQLKGMEDLQKQRLVALLEAEDRAIADQAKIDKLRADTEEELQRITARMTETAAQLDAIAQRVRATAAGAGEVVDLAANLQMLTEQVKFIDQAVRRLDSRQGDAGGGGIAAAAPESDPNRYTALIEDIGKVVEPPAGPSTVFFQFAGVSRDVAEAISNALKAEGYDMPGEERTGNAQRLHEVRYFFPGDAERAGKLVDDVNRVLADAGYRAEVTVRDFSGYSGIKPRQGTMELWLEPVARS